MRSPIGSVNTPRSNVRTGMLPNYNSPFSRLDQESGYRRWQGGRDRGSVPRGTTHRPHRRGGDRWYGYRRPSDCLSTRVGLFGARAGRYLGNRYHYRHFHDHDSYWRRGYTTYLWPTYSYGYPFGYSSFWFGRSSWPDVEYNTYETNYYIDDAYGQQAVQPTYAQPMTGNTTTAVTTPVPTYTHRQGAMQAFANGDFPLARREYVRAMLAEPEDPELVMLYGYAHFATGDYLVAAMAVRKALRADPTLVDHPVAIDQLYTDQLIYEQHLVALDSYLTNQPDDIDGRFLAGFVRYAAGDPRGAQPYFIHCASNGADDLLHFVMRDASIRADLMQQAAQNDTTSNVAPIQQQNLSEPELIEAVPESF